MKYPVVIDGKGSKTLIFAHGAGAPMDHPWMNELVSLLVKHNFKVVRFNFPYMNQIQETGKKRPPNAKKVLFDTWKQVIEENRPSSKSKLYIGGKSMGGRMASMIVDEHNVSGLICVGFPFHAPGKEAGDRIAHLGTLKTQTLIVQGERDSMGNKDDLKKYKLSRKVKVKWIEDGDHGLKPRKMSGLTLSENLMAASNLIAKFTE